MSDVIMSVQEIIDSALGDESKNTVNFRLLKAVLLILANQLRILQRHVSVNLSKRKTSTAPKLTVSEIKISCVPEGAIICKPPSTTDIEEQRERELRTIEQRADSYEEPARTPSPMTSAPSLSKERLLIVGPEGPTPRLSIVTRAQFDELVAVVRELEARFNPIGVPEFPENVEFMKALRQGASLTEAMAALQISARLEAFEKAFGIMVSLLTILARKTPGVDLTDFRALAKDFGMQQEISEDEVIQRKEASKEKLDEEPKDCVTYEELDNAMVELQSEVLESVKHMATTSKADSDKNKKTVSDLERQLSMSLNLGDRFEQLETEVAEYGEKIIAIDTGLSSQITSFQEHLAQMQYDLEIGLDNLTEALANASTDPEVIAELHRRLAALQEELDFSAIKEKESRAFQNDMALDLADLWKQIELIREAKSDRDEVADALRDKAGIGTLNGMVSLEQFHAVRGDLEKRIHAAYDKFNSQEIVWQKAIDDLLHKINEKGDWTQFYSLRDDISKHLNELRAKIDTLLEIVGEPRAAATSKLLFRNTECLSCRVPARMEMEPPLMPLLPPFRRANADGAEAAQPGEDGDHRICIQEQPIPHPRDPRSHVCRRYCGGSHTMIPTMARTPHGVTITPLPRDQTTSVGADGKTYMTEEVKVKKPCLACNIPKTPEPAEGEVAPKSKRMSDIESLDMMSCMDWLPAVKANSGSMTPLPSND